MRIDCCVTLGKERETVYSAEELVRDLDRAKVDIAVIFPADSETAVFNHRGNDFLLNESQRFPDRLIAACTASPWYGEEAVTEIERAGNAGAKMLVLNPTIQGFLINEDLGNPIIETAGKLGMPVYVHTGPHLYGAPWQLVDCALRFPEITFIMGHSGATDFWNDVIASASFAPNVFIEGSFARPVTFKMHVDGVGPEKGLMGSAAPRNNLVCEWELYEEEFDAVQYKGIFGDNLAKILKLEGDGE